MSRSNAEVVFTLGLQVLLLARTVLVPNKRG
jgi:hypothetical protein